MNKTSKFLFSTLVAAAAMTSTAFAWDPATNDYTIGSLVEFKAFRDYVNAGNNCAGKTVTLTANIDLAYEEWTPIGNSTNSFNGTFDGGNYTISNLVVNGGSGSNKGLFGFTQNGEVKNFTLENAQVSGRLNVGAVAGTPYTSKYSNITLTGTVQVSGLAYVGGVGGKNAYADWTNVHVNVSGDSYVKAISEENGNAYRTYVGGVIGFMGEGGHMLSNISSNINVEGSTCDVGGIVGIAHYGNKLVDVTCTADSIKLTNAPEASDATEVGAIAGVWHNENGYTVTFENCTVGEGTTVSKTYDVDGEKVTESLVGAGALYGSAYSANGTGVLNLSASDKQYAYDATIGRGVKEVYGEVTLGWDPANAEVPYVDATLNVAGMLDAEKLYVYVNSELAIQEGGSLNSNYLINWGEISAKNAESFNVDSLYLYGRETLDGTNYPTGDQLGKLTLVGTNATIGRLQLGRVDDVNNTVMGNASVTLTGSSLTVGTLAHGTVSGNEVQTIVADKDSSLALVKGGSLAGTLKSDGEVTLGWDPANAEVPYVDATLKVSGALDAKELYVYVNSELAIQEGGSLNSNYLINWGEISATNAESFNVNSLYLYGRETLDGTNYPTGDQLGKLTLVGTDATIGRLQLGRVDSASNTVMGNASVTLTNSSLTVGTLAHGTVSGNEVQTITLDDSTLKITGDAQLAGSLSLTNSTLTAKVISGNGLILGNGEVNLSADSISTRVFVGGTGFDEKGYAQYNDGEALRSTLVLDDVSGNGMAIKNKEFRVNNADITLNADVTADLGNGVYFYLRKSTLDLNGHDLVLNSGKFLPTGLDIVGEGTVIINSPSDQACWQSYASSIGSQVTVKGTKQFTIYEDLTVYGKLINEGRAGNGLTHIGFNDDFWTDGAVLTVSGANALVSQTGGAGVQIHGADAKQGIEASKVVVENGATVDWTQAGTVTNGGTIEINGATLMAGKLVNNGVINVENGTLVANGTVNSAGDPVNGIWISGESTVQINNLVGRVYVEDGAVLNSSYINTTAPDRGTTWFLGSVTLNNGFSTDYFYGAPSDNSAGVSSVGGTININGTVYATHSVDIQSDYTINGGKIVWGDPNGDGVYSFTIGLCNVTINSEIEANGANDSDGAPIQFQYANVVLNSTITQLGNHENDVVRVQSSDVVLNETGVINSTVEVSTNAAWKDYYQGVLTINGGTINGDVKVGKDAELNINSGTITGKITVNSGAQLTVAANSLLGTLNYTINNGGKLVVLAVDEAVSVAKGEAITLGQSGESVILTAAADIVVNSAVEIVDTADIKVDATDVVLAAWAFDVTNGSSEVTVTMEVGELSDADLANLAILHKADGSSEWTKTDIKGEYKDGKVTFKTNSFSSYAVAVPEPSMFGLFAGLGALLLVGTRRRRR